MKKKSVFIIVFFLAFFFLASSYALAIPALVVGDIEALVLLTHTSYLEGYPVLFFTHQLSPEEITRLLQKKMTIVFADNGLVDLTFDLVEPEYRHKLPEERKSRHFVAHVSDTYEIWGRGEGKPKILVDDKEIKREDGQIKTRIGKWEIANEGTRWRRLGSVELNEGRHSLSVNGQKDSFEELVIVPGTKLTEYFTTVADLLTSQKVDSAYLFSRRESEKDKTVRSFYLFREAHYKVKTKMSLNLEETSQAKSVGLDLKMGSPQELENWSFDASNADYGYLATKSGMFVLSTYFDGDSKEDEWVAIRRKDIKVDLERYPYFDLTYRVEDPGVQLVEAKLGLDFIGDGTVDDYLIIGKSAGNLELKDFNAYKALKRVFPDKEHYLLVDLGLYARKAKGVDCSRVGKEGSYSYYFEKIQLSSKSAMVIVPAWTSDFRDMKISFASENVEWNYFVSDDGMLSVNPYFDGGMVSPAETVVEETEEEYVRVRIPVSDIDMERYPLLRVIYRLQNSEVQRIDYELGIDLTNDGVADKVIPLRRRLILEDWEMSPPEKSKIFPGFNNLEVNAKERIEEVLGDTKDARLVSIFLYLKKGRSIDCSSSDREGIYTFDVKEIKVYRKSLPLLKEMLRADNKWVRKTSLFRIDDNSYALEGIDRVTIDDSEDIWGEMELLLPKGDHEFSGVPNKPFQVDMVLMEPVSSQKPVADEGPKINFRKVNPTRYVVDVKAREPFWLVFSESFHKGWKAYIRESTVGVSQQQEDEGLSVKAPRTRFEWSAVLSLLQDWGKREEIEEHYLVNGYANGWWVPVSDASRFEIVLEFTPQRLFEIGVVVSGVTVILCISYLVHSYLKGRRKSRDEAG